MPHSKSSSLKPRELGAWLARRAYRALQRVMMLDVTRLMSLVASDARETPADPRYSFGWLTADEVREFARDPANQLPFTFAEQVADERSCCFAVLDGSRLAGFIWIALHGIEAEQNRGRHPQSGVSLSYDGDSAFVFHAFTHAEFRGQGLLPACLTRALRALEPRGITRLLITTDWTNDSARRGIERAGFCQIGYFWRYGCRLLNFTKAPRGLASLGIRLGPPTAEAGGHGGSMRSSGNREASLSYHPFSPVEPLA